MTNSRQTSAAKTRIAPSILAANWGKIADEAKDAAAAGADWLHLDVMDGHFVPPITFGPDMVKAVKDACGLPIDVHLMIERPEQQLQAFAEAGADSITVHVETCPHLHRTVQQIHDLRCRAGVAINPGTPVEAAAPLVREMDLLLIMTVNPGWGGQDFIPGSDQRIKGAAELIRSSGRLIDLQVDGGINQQTATVAAGAGANVLVAGTAVFQQSDYRAAIEGLRQGGGRQ